MAEPERGPAAGACGSARAAPGTQGRELEPLEPASGEYRTAYEKHPLEISLADKVEHCLRAEAALRHEDVKVTAASVRAQQEQKLFVSSDGASIEHETVECGGGIDAMAVGDGITQIRSHPSAHGGSSAQAG